jgi:galactonate dehydratase
LPTTAKGGTRRNVILFDAFEKGRAMKLEGLEIFVIGTPPPGWGGRYWIIVKLTTACGITGYGEVYAAAVGPAAMRAVIAMSSSGTCRAKTPRISN